MGKSEIEISVVIPIYNSQEHLEECLNSLLNQTEKNAEIICVDDGSKDNSVEIIERIIQNDERVKIIKEHHQGAAHARNKGVSEAKGKYVLFLDSDDYFDLRLFEKVIQKGNNTSADVILFGAKKHDDRTGVVYDEPSYLRRNMLPKEEVFCGKDMDGQILNLTSSVPWTKAFRRDFILEQKLQFQDLPNSNDVFFVFVATAAAQKVTAIRDDLVYYRVYRKGSLQNCKKKHPFCFLQAYKATFCELKKRGIYESVKQSFCDRVLSGCLYNIDSVNDEVTRQQIEEKLAEDPFVQSEILGLPKESYFLENDYYRVKGLPYTVAVKKQLERRIPEDSIKVVYGSHLLKNVKISVVVPVYNTRKYIEETLQSILKQTFQEFEIICIDDGSIDGTSETLIEYAKRDRRISVYRQQNCGLSVARNQGMKVAKGEYIYFLDSDDLLQENALDVLYSQSSKKSLDILCCNGKTFYDDQELEKSFPEYQGYYERLGNYPEKCTGEEMICQMRAAKEYRVNTALYFWKTSFLKQNGLKFYPGIVHEDNSFTFIALLTAHRVGFCREKLYIRRIRESSIVTSEKKFAHTYGYFKNMQEMLAFLEKKTYPEETMRILLDIVNGIRWNVLKNYENLNKEEKWYFDGLSGFDKMQFKLLIEANSDLQNQLIVTKEKLQITYDEKYDRGLEINRLKKELNSIKKSRSYKLARIIGYPVRLIRRVIKKMQGEK